MSEKQKKIWITGASSGIGKSVAEKFANEGWKVAGSARRKELLDLQECILFCGGNIICHAIYLVDFRTT